MIQHTHKAHYFSNDTVFITDSLILQQDKLVKL